MNKKYIIIILVLASINSYSQTNNDTINFKTKEIVVSALKYPERLIEVPMSISLITRENLINIKGVGLEEALNLVPGVLVQSRAGFIDNRITIRGFGARGAGDRSNSGTSRGIKFYLDGLPLTEPDGRTSFDEIDFSLADKIEIVRSNASTIWGNAAGGVVSITTMPVFNKNYINATDIAGGYGLNKLFVQAGSVLANSRLNLGFSRTVFDGYRVNSNAEKYLLYLGFSSPINDKALLKVNLTAVSNDFSIPGPLTQAQFDFMPEMANPDYFNRRERRSNKSVRLGVTLERHINSDNQISFMTYLNPKFLQRSERNTFRDFTRYHLGGAANWMNKFDFSNDIHNTFLMGIDEQYQDGAIQFFFLKDGERGKLKTNKREGANTAGIYIQDEINFSDKFSALFGARYDNVTYYTRVYFDDGENKLTNNSEDKVYTHFTPKLGLTYRITQNHSIFANIGGGIEVPAGNETDPLGLLPSDTLHQINPLLEPIISTTYEIGDKFNLHFPHSFIRSLSNEVSFYYIDTKNELIPYTSGSYYLSAGKTSRIGVEWGLNFYFAHGLSLRSAITYSNNKYVNYWKETTLENPEADYKNNKIAGIPPFYYNTSLQWELPYLPNINAELQMQGIGSYFTDDANKYEVPSYNLINAKIGTSKPFKLAGGISIGGFISVNNITDVKYVASSFINPDPDKNTKLPMYLEPGLPRNLVIGLNLGWE
ncbi:MAG: Outer rane receptor protein [Ignavibacteria bacterium]|nr:Outer rane receptor protein [Ignavibacteria bacterium]